MTSARAQGAIACLDPAGMAEIESLIEYYMGNAKLLRETMLEIGLKVHGGIDAPYVFVDLEGKSSWDMFSKILEEAQVSGRIATLRGGLTSSEPGRIAAV